MSTNGRTISAVSLSGLKKAYGAVEVIHGVDCTIDAGEFVVILGPSGCGKSTLLRMIAGLEDITVGTIAIGDRVVNRLEPKDRDIAMVFQNYALYPHMSVYDNMAYGLRIRGMNREAIDARVRAAAATLELGALLARKPRQLSGGQRQRVAMGRAVVREPAVFLFDEPLSNLDAKLRVQMRLEMKRLHAQVGTTSIYVTHDQVEAMTLADRLIVMNAGRVEQIGTPLDVYNRPATAFVAGFIGSPAMNLLPGRLTPDGVDIGQGVTLPVEGSARDAGCAVLAGIRPEHVAIAPAGGDHLKLTVEAVEMLGADSMIHGRLGGNAMTVRVPGSAAVSAGEVVPISVAADRIGLFEIASGVRL